MGDDFPVLALNKQRNDASGGMDGQYVAPSGWRGRLCCMTGDDDAAGRM